MNYIITNGELCHYGVKGMKWGVRRYERQSMAVRELQDKRKTVAQKKGVTSREYDRLSKNLYIKKNQAALSKAKLDNDSTTKILAKQRIREGRYYKRHGMPYAERSDLRKVYGHNLSNKDVDAIATKTNMKAYNATKRKNTVKKAIAIAPAVIAVGTAVYNANANKIASSLSVKNVEKVNQFVNKYNRIVYKYTYQ